MKGLTCKEAEKIGRHFNNELAEYEKWWRDYVGPVGEPTLSDVIGHINAMFTMYQAVSVVAAKQNHFEKLYDENFLGVSHSNMKFFADCNDALEFFSDNITKGRK